MTDAIVTDITPYLTQRYFKDWSDVRLTKRLKLLELIEAGNGDFLTKGPMSDMSFPNGFNPDEEMSANLTAVRAEAVRRGVLVTSQ